MLGRYYAVYEGTKGTTFYNAAAALDSGDINASEGAWDKAESQHVAAEFVGGNDRTNIPFDFTISPNVLTLTYSPGGWKSANYQLPASDPSPYAGLLLADPRKWLEVTPVAGGQVINEGRLDGYIDPIWSGDQAPSTGLLLNNGLSISGLLYPRVPGEPETIQDHTVMLYLPSADAAIREASADLLTIEPTYMRYIQSSPAYEGLIDASIVPEHILPNSYYLQLELEYTGTTGPLNTRYQRSLNLNGNVAWLTSDGNAVTENTTERYYDLYAAGLNSVLQEDNLTSVSEDLNVTSKDLAVLNTDLSVLDTGPGAALPLFAPFYNTITLAPQSPTGWRNHLTTFGPAGLHAVLGAAYVNVLQALAIEAYYEGTNQGTFVTTRKKMITSDPEDYVNSVYNSNYGVLLDLEDIDASFTAPCPDPSDCDDLLLLETLNKINDNSPLGSATRLTDSSFGLNPVNLSDVIESTEMLYNPTNGLVSQVTRTFEEVLNNEPCHVETLMYVIKKFRGEETTPAQTYFISNRFDGSDDPITYYDSQIKSGQVYRYEIEKMILVFGNEYAYTSTEPALYRQSTPEPTATWHLEKSISFTNSADVKLLLVPHVIGDIQVITIDSPPVPPDVSFYPIYGSSNEIKILLNASTGVTEQTPIAILEQDKQYYANEYLAQTGQQITFGELRAVPNALTFKSDDPTNAYQLFRIDTKPTSYEDFQNGMLVIDPEFGVPGDLLDNILPNRTYYYCARAVDIRGNVSNPTHIFEIEIVDNGGQIFLRQDIFMFEQPQETFSKNGRRFIYVEPSTQQVVFEQSTDVNGVLEPNIGIPDTNLEPNPTTLGAPGVTKVWGDTYKIRVTSKKTGRKLDLNVTFKNSGIVNPSE